MPDVELDARAVEELDEDAPRFKRAVAVLVVGITLFGSSVAYLQTKESNLEDVAARNAQREAIQGLGAQVDASSGFATDLFLGSQVDVQIELQALNAGRANAVGDDPDPDQDVHTREANRHAAAAAAVAPHTPVDPADFATVLAAEAAGIEATDTARLRQAARADEANDRGSKADAYVAVLTVLAVALFLLGLSLTVQGRSRRVLAAPGVVIAIACVGWTGLIASQDVTRVSNEAARLAARGQRLQNTRDFEGSLEALDEAIEDSPEFGAAYARRAETRFLQGATQLAGGFISIADEEAVEDAVEDMERALERGMDTDVTALADAGFFTFLLGDFERSASLNRQAIDLNDQLATVWFNLGLAELALDDEDAAEDAYREGTRLTGDSPDPGTAGQILAGARTDLMVLRELLDDDELDDIEEQVEAAESELAETSLAIQPCAIDGGDCTDAEIGGDAEVVEGTFTRNGGTVFADVQTAGIEPGTPVLATWYVRANDGEPLQQTAIPVESVVVGDDGRITNAFGNLTATVPTDAGCPVAGEYVVRLVGGGRVIGEATGTIEPSLLGNAFSTFADRVQGIAVCVPDGFERQAADVNALDAFTGFLGDSFGFAVNTTPGNEAVEGADESAREIITELVGGTPATLDTRAVVLNGRDVRGNSIGLDGFAVSGLRGGVPVAVAFAFGPNGTAHTVLVTGSDDDALLDELIGLVTFTGLPEAG